MRPKIPPILVVLCALALTVLGAGCGGGSTPTNPSLAITPPNQTVDENGNIDFQPVFTDMPSGSVTWSVVQADGVTLDPNGGTIDANGHYTAPNTPGTYYIRCESVADSTKFSVVAVTVVAPPPPIVVTVTPESVDIYNDETWTFNADVSGTTNGAVTWSVEGGGAIGADGTFNPQGINGTYTVKATSVADNTKFDTATVNVTPRPVTVSPSVTVRPDTASVGATQTYQFGADVQNLTPDTVTWSVTEGDAGGTIDATGLYTAPAVPGGPYHVRATSTVDNTIYGEATVTVVPYITVTIGPHQVNIDPGQTRQMHYTITGATDTSVTWSTTGGSIDANGLFTATNVPGDYTITVTSVQDPTKSDVANVRVRVVIP